MHFVLKCTKHHKYAESQMPTCALLKVHFFVKFDWSKRQIYRTPHETQQVNTQNTKYAVVTYKMARNLKRALFNENHISHQVYRFYCFSNDHRTTKCLHM